MIVHFMVSRFFDHKVTESCLCDHQLDVCKTSSVREADGAEYGKGTEVRGTEVWGYGGMGVRRCGGTEVRTYSDITNSSHSAGVPLRPKTFRKRRLRVLDTDCLERAVRRAMSAGAMPALMSRVMRISCGDRR